MNKKKTRSSGGAGVASRDKPISSSSGGRSQQQQSSSKERIVASPMSSPNVDAYSNARLTHGCTSLIGANVLVETVAGEKFEGFFRTFSKQLEISIEQVHQVDPSDPTSINPETAKAGMVFPISDVVRCVAIDVDLNYANEGFMTDTQISKSKNGTSDIKNLVAWDDNDAEDANAVGCLDNTDNGWDPDAMFLANEKMYGVQSTFKANLEGYTIQLKGDKDSKEYRDREARAAELAREIEGTSGNKEAIELENGDEEEEFSAVVRPSSRGGQPRGGDREHESGKYVPPARRPPGGRNSAARPVTSRPDDRPQSHRRDYGASPASGHSGREHHGYHDDYNRNSGGGPNSRRYVKEERDSRGNTPHHQPRPSPMNTGMGSRPEKTRGDQLNELKNFRDNFHLEPTTNRGASTSPKVSPSGVDVTTTQQQRKEMSPSAVETTSAPSMGSSRRSSPPTASIIARQESVDAPIPSSQNSDPASPPATPVTTPLATTSGKKFTLNPNAKIFTPSSTPTRPPMAATPPRPPTAMAPAALSASQAPSGTAYAPFIQLPQGTYFQPPAGAPTANATNAYGAHAGGVSSNPAGHFMAGQQAPPPPPPRPFRPMVPGQTVTTRLPAPPAVVDVTPNNPQVLAATGPPLLSPHQSQNIAMMQMQQFNQQQQQQQQPPMVCGSSQPPTAALSNLMQAGGGGIIRQVVPPPDGGTGHWIPPPAGQQPGNTPPTSVPPLAGTPPAPSQGGAASMMPPVPQAQAAAAGSTPSPGPMPPNYMMPGPPPPGQFTHYPANFVMLSTAGPHIFQHPQQPQQPQQPMATAGGPPPVSMSGSYAPHLQYIVQPANAVPGQQNSPQMLAVMAAVAGGNGQHGPPLTAGPPPPQWGGFYADQESPAPYVRFYSPPGSAPPALIEAPPPHSMASPAQYISSDPDPGPGPQRVSSDSSGAGSECRKQFHPDVVSPQSHRTRQTTPPADKRHRFEPAYRTNNNYMGPTRFNKHYGHHDRRR